ncbi:hypothetical protein FACS189451_05150 [Bacteroidia bacterium]|nr:hypothetical protein FACS189451_05150 [Bacteroidia bacterium]
MKRIVFLLICVTISLVSSYAQGDGSITFNEKKHDFGQVHEKGGNVSFDFVLTNHAKEPLIINKVSASCGCTTPSWTKTPVEPKKSGTITVSYNPNGQHGSFLKSVTVYTNLSTTPVMLQISGEVTNAPVPPKTEEIYPVALGDYRLKSKELNFGKLDITGSKTVRLEVFNSSDKPVTQKITPPKYFTIHYSPVVEPKKESTVEITFLAKEYNKYGNVTGDLVFYINGGKQIFPYSALILDDFTNWDPNKKNNAGKLNTNMTTINFGNFSAGTSRTLKLSNSGNSVLNIKNIQSSSPWIVPSKTAFTINKGEIEEIKVQADKNHITAPFVSTLSIISDDPRNSMYEVKITANP